MAAIRYASVWFLSMAVYYLVLGGLRAYLIVCYRRRTPELERRCYLAAVSAEYPHGRHDRADGANGLRFFPIQAISSIFRHSIRFTRSYPRCVKDDPKRAGTIGIAASVALKHFGMEKVMLCDHSDFRLKLAEELGFAVCNPAAEDFAARAAAYFGTAPSLSGPTADIDCWLDAAGAESILNDFLRLGKIESRFVSVAVNNKPRTIDLLHTTYAQQSMIGSGGYMPEDVRDVQEIMSCGKWDLERIITHEFPLVE